MTVRRSRIRVIYGKELVDILRDRRTLIAMIVVPVLLYPLLMLGSVQAISAQEGSLRADRIVAATSDRRQKALLERLNELDRAALERLTEASTDDSAEEIRSFKLELRVVDASRDLPAGPEDLDALVQARAIHVGVEFSNIAAYEQDRGPLKVAFFFDPEEVRSASAASRLREMLERCRRRTTERLLADRHVPLEVLEPIVIKNVELPTAGSILSQILPLILVLMTITGAIYPAIDLTAGERERGTLETLMVCPVPVIHLIVGKFLVITTIAIMGAVLNLASISATVYFGGFQAVLSGSEGVAFPFAVFPVILLALVPFAIFFSAVMIAVCSYAHTFKEAQNYITPIILAALVPGGIAALPASKLAGPMLVMPVANMVLLTKELLLGASAGRIIGGNVTFTALAWVLASTTIYAVAAVAVAARIFGTESVIFSDTGSIRSAFARRLFRPTRGPSVSMACLVVALLFPAWFYFQNGLSAGSGEDMMAAFRGTALWMPVFFVGVPLLVLLYWKVDIAATWRFRATRLRFYAAAVLIGLSAWVPLDQIVALQSTLVPLPEAILSAEARFLTGLENTSPWLALVLIAVVPGVCEELFFRGFFLSGLSGAARKWPAIIITACVFGVFHFFFFKIPTTVVLGVVLGYVCWQSGSIGPAIVAHVVHNGFVIARTPAMLDFHARLGIDPDAPLGHLPGAVILGGIAVLASGLFLCRRACADPEPRAAV